ncbi:MAG: hypothetical protein ACW99U_06415 [Candidatus Thorarchaeota archaeon]
MSMQSVTSTVTIPKSIGPQIIIESLTTGHGYKWTFLMRSPKRVAHAQSARRDLPELVLIDHAILVWDGDDAFPERLKRVISLLSSSQGGIRHG